MPRQKRVNKSKEEIEAQLKKAQRVERQKSLAKLIFPYIADLETIYDAQTVCNAVAGFIKFGLEKEESKHKVGKLEIDISGSEKGKVKTAVQNILGLIELENAKEAANLLEIMGAKLPEHLMLRHLKDPMSVIKVKEFIA